MPFAVEVVFLWLPKSPVAQLPLLDETLEQNDIELNGGLFLPKSLRLFSRNRPAFHADDFYLKDAPRFLDARLKLESPWADRAVW